MIKKKPQTRPKFRFGRKKNKTKRRQMKNIRTMKTTVLVLSLLATLCHGKDIATPHVINGDEAVPHSHPYMLALQLVGDGDSPGDLFCGGSLLSENWAITAAHCVDKGQSFVVTAGSHNVVQNEESQQRISVSEVIIHPGWNRTTTLNDLALIKLKDGARIDGETVKTIRLPKLSDKEKSFYNYDATLTGWGRPSPSSHKTSPTLQTMTERVMSNLVCQAAYLFLNVANTNICIHGIRVKGGCSGDSGSPLVVTEEDGERTVIGLASWVYSTCVIWPTVFTRVSSYVDWIHEQTGVPVRN